MRARDRGRGTPRGRRQPGHLPRVGDGRRGALLATARVRKISFTGSTEVGKELIRLSADQVKRHARSSSAATRRTSIFDDADLDEAVDGADRLEVPQRRPDLRLREPHLRAERASTTSFVERSPPRRATIEVGHGTDEGVTIGPLIDDRAVDKVEEHVQDALAHGATARHRRRAPLGRRRHAGSLLRADRARGRHARRC